MQVDAHDSVAEDWLVNTSEAEMEGLDTRALYRSLRRPQAAPGASETMPESVLWKSWLELRRRGEGPRADEQFLAGLRRILRRREIGVAELATADGDRQEHRRCEDPFLAELWKAYKRCVQQSRTGPASQLLQDLEARVLSSQGSP